VCALLINLINSHSASRERSIYYIIADRILYYYVPPHDICFFRPAVCDDGFTRVLYGGILCTTIAAQYNNNVHGGRVIFSG